MRRGTERSHLFASIDGPALGRLGDRHDARLHRVLVANTAHCLLQHRGGQLAIGRRQVDQLASGQQLRRAAFIEVDVRRLGADDRVEGPCHGAQREHIGAGAIPDQERLGIVAELRPEPRQSALRPRVCPIWQCRTFVAGLARGEDGRMHRRRIVACKAAGPAHSGAAGGVSLSAQSAMMLPSGSATIAMMPKPCCVGSAMNFTPCSPRLEQKSSRPGM